MKAITEMSRKELVAAAREIGIAKANNIKSAVLIEELEKFAKAEEAKIAEEKAKAEEEKVAEEKSAPASETENAVVVLRKWEREGGKWIDKGFVTKLHKGMTKTEIINQYRGNNSLDAVIWESPVSVFTKKDYEKFLESAGAYKANKGFTEEFVREEVGAYFA